MNDLIEFPSPEAIEDPSDSQLASVASLGRRQVELEREVARLTTELKAAIAALMQVSQHDLPLAMVEAGYAAPSSLVAAGLKIALTDKLIGGKLTDPAGLTYVDEHEGSSIIRSQMIVELDAGDTETALRLYEMMRTDPAANKFKRLTLEKSVPAPTIAKFARERNLGNDPDVLKLIGVYRRVSAQVGNRRPKTVELTGLEILDD
jgi:hypothetical protein